MTRSFQSIIDALPPERQARIAKRAAELIPDGVHFLSDGSMDIMLRIAAKAKIAEARFLKRDPE